MSVRSIHDPSAASCVFPCAKNGSEWCPQQIQIHIAYLLCCCLLQHRFWQIVSQVSVIEYMKELLCALKLWLKCIKLNIGTMLSPISYFETTCFVNIMVSIFPLFFGYRFCLVFFIVCLISSAEWGISQPVSLVLHSHRTCPCWWRNLQSESNSISKNVPVLYI